MVRVVIVVALAVLCGCTEQPWDGTYSLDATLVSDGCEGSVVLGERHVEIDTTQRTLRTDGGDIRTIPIRFEDGRLTASHRWTSHDCGAVQDSWVFEKSGGGGLSGQSISSGMLPPNCSSACTSIWDLKAKRIKRSFDEVAAERERKPPEPKPQSCSWEYSLIDSRKGKKDSLFVLKDYLDNLVQIRDAQMVWYVDDPNRKGWLKQDWNTATQVYKDKEAILRLARTLDINRSLIVLVDLNSGTYRIDTTRIRNAGYNLKSYTAEWKCE